MFIVAYTGSCLDIDGGVSGFRFWSLIIIIIEIVIRWILGHVLLLNGQIYIRLLDVAGVLDLSCVNGSQLLLWIFTAINYRHVELAPRPICSILISHKLTSRPLWLIIIVIKQLRLISSTWILINIAHIELKLVKRIVLHSIKRILLLLSLIYRLINSLIQWLSNLIRSLVHNLRLKFWHH